MVFLPDYSRVTLESKVCNNMSGLLSYNHITEERLFFLPLALTQMNFNQFYDEMKSLNNV